MKTTLSSRERMLLAIDHREADHVPLALHPFGWNPPRGLEYGDAFERVAKFLAFGLDDTVGLHPPSRHHPDVTTRTRRTAPPDERYPLLHKEYKTPQGAMSQTARQTNDWPHGDDVPVTSDHNIPRSRKFLVEDEADLEKLPYLFFPPDRGQLDDFREQGDATRLFAEECGVMVEGHCGGFGDYAAWFMGLENLMMAMYDRPAFVHRLLDTILEWEMRDLDVLLDCGVADMVVHRGWYECSDFWSPRFYREFIAPRLARKIQAAHDAGVRFGYIMSTGIMPLLDVFRELDFDVLIHVDPVQGGVDLAALRDAIGDRICVWGGMNGPVTLTQGSRDDIRDAVTHAVSTLAPGGGLILEPADCLTEDIPAENILTLIERWREIATYPIRV